MTKQRRSRQPVDTDIKTGHHGSLNGPPSSILRRHDLVTLIGRQPRSFETAPMLAPVERLLSTGSSRSRAVVFRCSNTACVVSIHFSTTSVEFCGVAEARLAAGTSVISFRVVGPTGQAFVVTCEGAALDHPISGTVPSGGSRKLAVVSE